MDDENVARAEVSEELFERGYIEGERRAYLSLLRQCINNLGEEERDRSAWIIERQEAIARLRGLCEKHGDNDWPDSLHLADIIEKHLGDYLEE
jgi:truncated hemoglobin YjbI